jgi:hypothetical protein
MKEQKVEAAKDFTGLDVLWRFLAALALVLITFNPSGYSAFHWLRSSIGEGSFGPLHAIAILLLIAGWTIVWIATWRALDTLGVVLASLTLAAIVWLLVDVGILSAGSVSAVTWIVLVCLAAVLAIGMSWAHIWRRLTGQLSVEHVED